MTVISAAPPVAPACPIGHDLPFHFCSVCRSPVCPADLTWVDYLPRHRACDPEHPDSLLGLVVMEAES